MNNPFDYTPDKECDNAFLQLLDKLEHIKSHENTEGDLNDDNEYIMQEFKSGKMLGVLIAEDIDGKRHTLYAFSGQLGKYGFHYPGFVDPIFDYLQPHGYFKTKEAEISRQNLEIDLYERTKLSEAISLYENARQKGEAEVVKFREKCRLSKKRREIKRDTGFVSDEEKAAMIRRSQFEKAELRRLKKRISLELEPYSDNLRNANIIFAEMKDKRRMESEALQKWLFSNFMILNAQGERKNLLEIFRDTAFGFPPSGAGECCAPKLLQAAYLKGFTPISMAEYWYGESKRGEVRIHGKSYPACRGKCRPILNWMLQGLDVQPPLDHEHNSETTGEPEIIFENEWFCIVNKPSGMLSVPGKVSSQSLQEWLNTKYGDACNVKPAHRLDQDTSGLLLATFGQESYKQMQSLFATGKVKKTYCALLEGDYNANGVRPKGRIELPLIPDILDRPRQMVDFKNGKMALTEYEFSDIQNGRSRIIFHPHTGRTHQLRVHAASQSGLGMPIAGDRLYGKKSGNTPERLYLHSQKLEFTFPIDGQHYIFESRVPF